VTSGLDVLGKEAQTAEGVTLLETIGARAARERIPFSGFFDLTYRCNFRCSHCYVGHRVARSRSESGELQTRPILDLLVGAADAGCLFLTLSGGEPLIRDDFVEIYVKAKKLGMLVTVFTNASLIGRAHLDAFSEYPPESVEVSMYGASDATYERVTGYSGGFRRVMTGVEALQERGVRVAIKTVIIRDNLEEVRSIGALAAKLGVELKLDPQVIPRLDGDCGPLAQRVEPARAVEIALSVQDRRRELAEYYWQHMEKEGRRVEAPARLFMCGAGISSFHIDAVGNMRPCLLALTMEHNAVTEGFLRAWKAVTAEIDAVASVERTECTGCANLPLCGYCPGSFALENPRDLRPPEYACRLGESRRRAIDTVRPETKDA
jgi:radical SAM protein with 4Fe4S-binding SPASM domain